MPSAEQITQTVHRYLDTVANGDADQIATLYAEDATVEDPVGGEVHIGRQAIRGFYTAVENAEQPSGCRDAAGLGHEAAFYSRSPSIGTACGSSIISVMTFDDDGKITSMKAYWGPENITRSSVERRTLRLIGGRRQKTANHIAM